MLFIRPMITIKSVVPPMDYCNEELTPMGCPSKGPKKAHQDGEEAAQEHSTTRGVHKGAFFMLSEPLAYRVRQCLSLAAGETLDALERAAASPGALQGARRKHRGGKIHFPDGSLILKTQ